MRSQVDLNAGDERAEQIEDVSFAIGADGLDDCLRDRESAPDDRRAAAVLREHFRDGVGIGEKSFRRSTTRRSSAPAGSRCPARAARLS